MKCYGHHAAPEGAFIAKKSWERFDHGIVNYIEKDSQKV